MELKDTRFYKILQFYEKMNGFRISNVKISLISLKRSTMCFYAFWYLRNAISQRNKLLPLMLTLTYSLEELEVFFYAVEKRPFTQEM
ncbi:Hypothetical predicted protein [Octopus vulgaris]|uniref:Uncharacterized protein n=1 Tax=Octopus vulgaris TaxID=6645 RepID=A0AA36B541_OCTVU|nr:Hypothetical predicted protein [Octopus vulgaris]